MPETVVDKSRKLFSVLDEYVARLPRDRKFTIGDRLLERGLTVMECVVEAFYGPRQAKPPLLKRVNIQLEVIRQLLRFLLESKTHDIKKHEHLNRTIDELGISIGGWLKTLGAPASDA